VAKRQRIEVELSPEDALEQIEASVGRDRGWTMEREDGRLLIYPSDPTRLVLDPQPDSELYERLPYPETLAVCVRAEALEAGGAQVEAELVRRQVGALVREAAWQMLHPISYPSGGPVLHVIALARWRESRRGGRRKLLRLAIEPLLAHERRPEQGPFRTG
jgi:hypothetical protein